MQRNQNFVSGAAAGLLLYLALPAAAQIATGPIGFPRWDVLAQSTEGLHFGQNALPKPGDADRDFDFDQHDLVQVFLAQKYRTGLPASWEEGDWNVDSQGLPAGDGLFDQHDLMTALTLGEYLSHDEEALAPDGRLNDLKTSILYDAATGEVSLDAPFGSELTSINIDSAAGVFVGTSALNLSGSFDHHADYNIFKATFGSTFGSISFGNIARPGLSREFLLRDLTIVGSLDMGGALGEVDLIYAPEPASWLLLGLGGAWILGAYRRPRTRPQV